jgi:large conductance mechanosensitive channel
VKDFKAFLRGKLVDTAVGIVIGVAFTAVVTALFGELVTPLLAAIGGKPDFRGALVHDQQEPLPLRGLIDAAPLFVLIAAAIFFLVVKPVNALVAPTRRERPPATRNRPECLSEIPLAAHRCAVRASEVAPA